MRTVTRHLSPAFLLSLEIHMSSARQELLRLLAHTSFKLGEFKLSSGATRDYYIDCRTPTLERRPSAA